MSGSLLMLLAIIALHLLHARQTGGATFGLQELLQARLPLETQLWLYGAFFLAFAIKFPLFPLHTWLPDAHTDAPTAGSLILAGLLLKTGSYGLIRFGYPLFPQAAQLLTPLFYGLALVGIAYASLVAFAQEDMKRLIAYSSIGHMGYIAIGIAAWQPLALSGAIIQMASHGLTTGALFCMAGMLDERAHTREIRAFGGLWGKIPLWSCFFLFFSLASAGLPGLNNFVGEFLILAGTFGKSPLVAALAFGGIVLTLIYTLRLIQELLFQGERQPLVLWDLNCRELCLLGMMALLNIWIGIHPAPLLELIRTPVQLLLGGAP
jgi:NADH-quinone oxidoreductase subunit M